MKMKRLMSNTMGHTLSVSNLESVSIDMIKSLVSKHGVIVLKDIDCIHVNELLAFASKFGQLIKVPNGFAFNPFCDEPFVSNITNIDPLTGNVINNLQTAEYLHHDGDFWKNNFIFTLLYGDIIPSIGGNTHFIDARLAHDHLFKNYKTEIYDLIRDKNVVIDVNDVPDFKGSAFLDEFNAIHDVSKHSIVSKHRITNELVLYYAHKDALIDG